MKILEQHDSCKDGGKKLFFNTTSSDHSGTRLDERDRSLNMTWLRSGSMPLGQINWGRQTSQAAHFCDANANVRHDELPPRELANLFRPKSNYKGSPALARTISAYGETFAGG